ncbi:hypothetical protein [Yinghuangia seranimata]|uniref:hypothetical protein n=1 Tax=Yinghuangia seranimata TaxID=408067 RepID=UPI00248B7285|nr:hypothetical protein [Yinghuangia seranimata]MDI2126395.1 hypothetical protein [Yinghuangia seranimata]
MRVATRKDEYDAATRQGMRVFTAAPALFDAGAGVMLFVASGVAARRRGGAGAVV